GIPAAGVTLREQTSGGRENPQGRRGGRRQPANPDAWWSFSPEALKLPHPGMTSTIHGQADHPGPDKHAYLQGLHDRGGPPPAQCPGRAQVRPPARAFVPDRDPRGWRYRSRAWLGNGFRRYQGRLPAGVRTHRPSLSQRHRWPGQPDQRAAGAMDLAAIEAIAAGAGAGGGPQDLYIRSQLFRKLTHRVMASVSGNSMI